MKRGPLIALLVVIVLILGLVALAGIVYLNFTAEPSLPEQATLRIRLTGSLVESPVVQFPQLKTDGMSIRELWLQLQRAKIDRRVRGIILKLSDFQSGYAKAAEIGRLITDFRQSKKPVIAFVESGGMGELYLASFADKAYAMTGGDLLVYGPAAEATFLKNTLGKLGIVPQMFHVGEYKTAANTFTEDHMTPPHRESIEVLLQDIYTSVVEGIARNRHLDATQVRRVLDESPLPTAAYVQARLLDGQLYEDEVDSAFKTTLPVVEFSTYRKTTSPRPFSGADQIAVIFAAGEINSGASGGQSLFGGDVLGSDTLAGQLASARKSSAVKAVVLRIDSPGGSALASDVILREAQLLAKRKPLVVSMSDMAASGGYWISMAAQKIVAEPETITGSIGVVGGKFVLRDFYHKIGITKEIVRTTPYSAMFSDYAEFSPEETRKIVTMMDTYYQSFLDKVSTGRNLPRAEVDRIGRGRVWSGRRALELKLVDSLGGLNDAIAEARKLARIPANRKTGVRVYPVERDLFSILLDMFDTSARATTSPLDAKAQLEAYRRFLPAYRLPFNLAID